MTFKFLGHPSVNQIDQLENYLNLRYRNIDLQIDSLQTEIDNLKSFLSRLQRAEGILGSIYGKADVEYALSKYIRSPVLNEDLSYFESHKLDSTKTASIIDSLLKPWQSHLRKDEKLEYKIKKTSYLIEQKSFQLRALKELKNDLRDV